MAGCLPASFVVNAFATKEQAVTQFHADASFFYLVEDSGRGAIAGESFRIVK